MRILLLGFILAFAGSFGSQASADGVASSMNIYNFGGSCASMGPWTMQALEQTRKIRQIVEDLMKDPNCKDKGLESVIQELQASDNAITAPVGTNQENDRLQTLPQEISSLRAAADQAPPGSPLRRDAMGVLMQHSLETAFLRNDIGVLDEKTGMYRGTVGGGMRGLGALVRSIPEGVNTSLRIYEHLADKIPSLDQCLVGKPPQVAAGVAAGADIGSGMLTSAGAALFPAVFRLGAALGNSPAGTLGHFSSATGKLLNFWRDRKFSLVLRSLNENDLWTSISCLLETTTQVYCSALDAQKLLNASYDSNKPIFPKGTDMKLQNPLTGYYIMTQLIPLITQWLQKVQFGYSPQWSTDANFKAITLDNVNQFLRNYFIIPGTYRENIRTMMSVPATDLKGRKASLFIALQNLVNSLTGGAASGDPLASPNATSLNFFVQSMQAFDIPFFLLDMATPSIVIQSNVGTNGIDWSNWVISPTGDFANVPAFNDPVALSEKISTRLQNLMDLALAKASNYFRDRMIVNKQNVINQSLVGMTYTVHDSLYYILRYLDVLEQLIDKYHGQQALKPSIEDTKYKIATVLNSYRDLRALKDMPVRSAADHKKVQDAADKVLQTAYDQFEVLMQRDSYITTQLNTFIYYDYVLRVQNHIGFGDYESDLLRVTGQEFLNLLSQVTGTPPQHVENDIANAKRISRTNIAAVEQVFRDSIMVALERLSLTANGIQPTDWRLFWSSFNRLYRDSTGGQMRKDNPGTTYLGGFIGALFPPVMTPFLMHERLKLRPDLYNFYRGQVQNIRPSSDPDQDFARFRDRICIQTLAFEDRSFYDAYCTEVSPTTKKRVGIVLKTGWKNANPDFYLNASWDKYMKNGQDKRPPTDESICAFRDFNRRNQVDYLIRYLKNYSFGNQSDLDQYTPPPSPIEVQKAIDKEVKDGKRLGPKVKRPK